MEEISAYFDDFETDIVRNASVNVSVNLRTIGTHVTVRTFLHSWTPNQLVRKVDIYRVESQVLSAGTSQAETIILAIIILICISLFCCFVVALVRLNKSIKKVFKFLIGLRKTTKVKGPRSTTSRPRMSLGQFSPYMSTSMNPVMQRELAEIQPLTRQGHRQPTVHLAPEQEAEASVAPESGSDLPVAQAHQSRPSLPQLAIPSFVQALMQGRRAGS